MKLSEILHYKNNFLLWIDLLFRPWKIFQAIKSHIKSKESEIEKELDAKVELLEFQQYERGIVLGKNQIPVLRIPIHGIEKPYAEWGASELAEKNTSFEQKKLSPIMTSFSSYHSGSIDVKKEAANVLADELVDKGFLSSTIDRGVITFSINCFGIE